MKAQAPSNKQQASSIKQNGRVPAHKLSPGATNCRATFYCLDRSKSRRPKILVAWIMDLGHCGIIERRLLCLNFGKSLFMILIRSMVDQRRADGTTQPVLLRDTFLKNFPHAKLLLNIVKKSKTGWMLPLKKLLADQASLTLIACFRCVSGSMATDRMNFPFHIIANLQDPGAKAPGLLIINNCDKAQALGGTRPQARCAVMSH